MQGTLDTYFAIEINGNEFEIDIEFDYCVSGGQKGIYHMAPEYCQPELPPDYEVELKKCSLGYGSQAIDLKESRWWDIVQEGLNDNDRIIEMVDEDMESQSMDEY